MSGFCIYFAFEKTGLVPIIPPSTVMGVALSVKVEDAEVYGSVEGTLESTSKICVRSTGNVTGTVIYRKMVRVYTPNGGKMYLRNLGVLFCVGG